VGGNIELIRGGYVAWNRGSGVAVQSGVDAHVWTLANGRVITMRWLQGDDAAQLAGEGGG
jgi:hypothetical protein